MRSASLPSFKTILFKTPLCTPGACWFFFREKEVGWRGKVWYCWWKKSCTTWYGEYTTIYNYSAFFQTRAGFLPSKVSVKIMRIKGSTPPPMPTPPRNKALFTSWGVVHHHCPLIIRELGGGVPLDSHDKNINSSSSILGLDSSCKQSKKTTYYSWWLIHPNWKNMRKSNWIISPRWNWDLISREGGTQKGRR